VGLIDVKEKRSAFAVFKLLNFNELPKGPESNGVQGVVGSNPIAPTNNLQCSSGVATMAAPLFLWTLSYKNLFYSIVAEEVYLIPLSFQDRSRRFQCQRPLSYPSNQSVKNLV
jgi:hypothetical protein